MFERFAVVVGLAFGSASAVQAQEVRLYFGDQFTAAALVTVDRNDPTLNGFGIRVGGGYEQIGNNHVEPFTSLVALLPNGFFETPDNQDLPGIILQNEMYKEGGLCAFLPASAGIVTASPDRNRHFDRAIIALSEREINRALDLGCLAIENRGAGRGGSLDL